MFTTRKSLFALAGAAALMLLGAGAQAANYYVNVNTGLDSNPGTQAKPFKSIQQAITFVPGSSTIVVAAGTYHESLTWTNKTLFIRGAGEGLSIIDPSIVGHGPGGRCLYVQSKYSQIGGFTFQNGSAMDFGGGMYSVSSILTIDHCTFRGNAAKQGGGMYNFVASLTVTNCTFTHNTATNNAATLFSGGGGGMLNVDCSPTITNCTFSHNRAYGVNTFGGGMGNLTTNPSLGSSKPIVTACTFDNNLADDSGGGMGCVYSNPTVTDCTFTNNTANLLPTAPRGMGGGIFNLNPSPTITRCLFDGNQAKDGGGIGNLGNNTMTLTDSTFSNNAASSNGGGICNYGDGTNTNVVMHIVTNCTFGQNRAGNDGGGLFNQSSRPILSNSNVVGNSASANGGGVYNQNSNSAMTSCLVSGNSANVNGGGVYSQNSNPTMTNCLLMGNVANSGGGMYNASSRPVVTNCTMTQNAVVGVFTVGGIYNDSKSSSTVTNCILWGNTVGGIYGSAAISYSDIQDVHNIQPDQHGNFAADPLFVDAVNWDLHLMPGSPCRDRGSNAIVISLGILIDLDGVTRILDSSGHPGGSVDLGPYEWHP